MPLWLIILFILFSLLLIYAAAALFKKGKKQFGKATVSAYILYALIFAAVWIFRLSIPSYLMFLTMLSIFIVAFFGYYRAWFNRSKVFDRYLHVLVPFSFSLFLYCVIQNLFLTGGSKAFQSLFIFTISMTLATLNELLEAAIDAVSNANNQRGLKDTNTDLLGSFIGSLLAGIFAYFFLL